ncbi:hypothetical protein [Saccharopolyspora rosea]|uniref:Uncharacterized protein n=1 Tax=Saccharopolyspora rosea TaxID=524884 RepID=A0ABW3G3G2_9PSEU|nr:hypothetical protein [Saccharopolyspora rosea]
MSLPELSRQLSDEVDRLVGEGRAAEVGAEDLRRLVSSVVRLYAAANEGADEEVEPLDDDIATTDAVVLATALLKAQDLNPFDLALWFSRSRVAG